MRLHMRLQKMRFTVTNWLGELEGAFADERPDIPEEHVHGLSDAQLLGLDGAEEYASDLDDMEQHLREALEHLEEVILTTLKEVRPQ